jgi:hypothetical protein
MGPFFLATRKSLPKIARTAGGFPSKWDASV